MVRMYNSFGINKPDIETVKRIGCPPMLQSMVQGAESDAHPAKVNRYLWWALSPLVYLIDAYTSRRCFYQDIYIMLLSGQSLAITI